MIHHKLRDQVHKISLNWITLTSQGFWFEEHELPRKLSVETTMAIDLATFCNIVCLLDLTFKTLKLYIALCIFLSIIISVRNCELCRKKNRKYPIIFKIRTSCIRVSGPAANVKNLDLHSSGPLIRVLTKAIDLFSVFFKNSVWKLPKLLSKVGRFKIYLTSLELGYYGVKETFVTRTRHTWAITSVCHVSG